MTVGAALAAARSALRAENSAQLDASWLLGALLDRTPAWLLAHAEEPLDASLAERFRAAVARRAAGEPVAYILGSAGFYGRRFAVSSAVLVPRPESELLVELALAALRGWPSAPRVCDVGTGSGILAVTVAAELTNAAVTAIDISSAALTCARENARAYGVEARVRFVLGDVFEAPQASAAAGAVPLGPFACVVANLPYVPTSEIAERPDPTAYEPRLALDGGPDGLEVYRALLARAPALLEAGGTLLMEAGPGTTGALAELARAAFPLTTFVDVVRDYARLERVVVVRVPGEPPGRGAKPHLP